MFMYIHTCTCTYIHVPVHTYMYLYLYTCTCTYIHVPVHTYMYMYLCAFLMCEVSVPDSVSVMKRLPFSLLPEYNPGGEGRGERRGGERGGEGRGGGGGRYTYMYMYTLPMHKHVYCMHVAVAREDSMSSACIQGMCCPVWSLLLHRLPLVITLTFELTATKCVQGQRSKVK